MVRTHGLTHVALAVRDVGVSSRFYRDILGAVEIYNDGAFVQLQTPGSRDVLVLEHNPRKAGKPGSVIHFGFRLVDAADIQAAIDAVIAARGHCARAWGVRAGRTVPLREGSGWV